MKLPTINENVVFVLALVTALVWAIFFFPKPAGAQVVVQIESPYQQCVDTCLAYNGYTTATYSFCQYQCAYPYPSVVVGGVWIGGIWYPRGHDRDHREPRHDEPRHGHDGDHHGRR